jgi:hypothetical protein
VVTQRTSSQCCQRRIVILRAPCDDLATTFLSPRMTSFVFVDETTNATQGVSQPLFFDFTDKWGDHPGGGSTVQTLFDKSTPAALNFTFSGVYI